MTLSDQKTLDVCAAWGIEGIDLARLPPREAEFFWNDFHDTEFGSRSLAAIVAKHLLESAPLVR